MLGSEKIFHWSKILASLEKEKFLIVPHKGQKSVPLHNHAFLELTYIENGSTEHTLDGKTATLSKGDYLIVDYGSRHSYQAISKDGYDNLDCLFLPELLDPILKGTQSLRAVLEHYLLHFNMQALVQNPARIVFHDETGRIYELLQRIRDEEKRREAGFTELVRCYLIEILVLTMRQLEDTKAASAGPDITAFLSAYVAEHYMEEITLCELAARLNYSLPYVSKKFKEDTGESFMQYLQRHRVHEGCRLLISSQYSLGEITEMVGYRDSKFFSALIKRTTGMSPAEFRRHCRTANPTIQKRS
ncbi:MAG: helix-turn-helix domain-containing protein [Ruminococcaceae bacterium]|nr:helix-turn-helix domain-containing protein [Oscillospiraceae bacterium]